MVFGFTAVNHMSKVEKYEIILDRSSKIFWQGESITGTLRLKTTEPITCRSVRLLFQGESHCHWHRGSGDDRKDFDNCLNYVNLRKTIAIYGNFFPTLVLDSCGENALFNRKTIGDGDLDIPLLSPLGTFGLAIRVMDYDWGKKDDLLGEAWVDPQVLLMNPGTMAKFDLVRKGKPEKGSVTVSAILVDNTSSVANQIQSQGTQGNQFVVGQTVLRLVIHEATGLRKADTFGKNDVYVQAYTLALNTDISKGIPPPEVNYILNAGEIMLPF